MTALHMSVVTGQAEMVSVLLSAGASVNIQDGKSGRTAVFHAAEHNLYRIASMLLQKGTANEYCIDTSTFKHILFLSTTPHTFPHDSSV